MKPYETYIQYRERVQDPISPTFCAAKWLNATIWLGSGTTASCHHPPAHKISQEEIANNPSALHNTTIKKEARAQMLRGERPSECDYCWKIEDMKANNVSDRIFKTLIHDEADIQRLAHLSPEDAVTPRTLEVAFDRTCNFACSYCNPSFSTKWARDIQEYGGYKNLVSDGSKQYTHDGSWAQPFGAHETNPYIEAFWRWWPELFKNLKELRVTGGEPLMSSDVWRLFDYFSQHGSGEMLFTINSNLGAKDELIDKLIEKSHSVAKFDIYTSCEAIGAQAEYIRDGLDFQKWIRNVERVLKEGNIREFHVMMTVNALCLFSITDLMDQLLDLKARYGRTQGVWTLNILRFPSFMSPLVLPEPIKKDRQLHLLGWLEKNRSHPMLHDIERAGIERLINYLGLVQVPHGRTSSLESRWRDFKSFFSQYDQRRKKSFSTTFPSALTDWYETLPLTDLGDEGIQIREENVELRQLAAKEGWVLNPQGENPR